MELLAKSEFKAFLAMAATPAILDLMDGHYVPPAASARLPDPDTVSVSVEGAGQCELASTRHCRRQDLPLIASGMRLYKELGFEALLEALEKSLVVQQEVNIASRYKDKYRTRLTELQGVVLGNVLYFLGSL